MKIAINRIDSYFGISKKLKDYLISKGMKITKREEKTGNLINKNAEIIDNTDGFSKEFFFIDDYTINDDKYFPKIRTDFRLIEGIEKLGNKASGEKSNIKIVSIPDDVDFVIKGRGSSSEYISEKHRHWY